MENEWGVQLRSYQIEIAETILDTVASKSKALISIAIGSGRIVTITWALNQLFKKAKIKRVLIVTPSCVLRDQFIYILKKYSSDNARILKLEKHTKSELSEELQLPTIMVSTLSMFRRLANSISPDFFDIIFLDDCQNMSERDWSSVSKLKPPWIAVTSIHPLKISQKILSALGKQAPDYSYGITPIRLRDLAEIRMGAPYSTKQLLSKGMWKFFRPRDIKKNGFIQNLTYISEDVAKKKANFSLKVGDIVLQNIFEFGRMAIVRKENLPAVASQNLFIIRSKSIPPKILFEYLQSEAIADAFRKQLEDLAHGNIIRHISLRDVGEIPVPMPFSKKQIRYFAMFSRSLQTKRDIEKARNELAHLREAYKQFSESEE